MCVGCVCVVVAQCFMKNENEIYPLQKRCAKDIIPPMGCNSPVQCFSVV